jgi:hypothetical protein
MCCSWPGSGCPTGCLVAGQVTAVDGTSGGGFTAHVLPGTEPSAFGGDVLVRLAPDDPAAGQPPPPARVQVYVLGGRLIRSPPGRGMT